MMGLSRAHWWAKKIINLNLTEFESQNKSTQPYPPPHKNQPKALGWDVLSRFY